MPCAQFLAKLHLNERNEFTHKFRGERDAKERFRDFDNPWIRRSRDPVIREFNDPRICRSIDSNDPRIVERFSYSILIKYDMYDFLFND